MKRLMILLSVILIIQQICRAQTLPTKKQQYQFLQWYVTNQYPSKLSDRLEKFNYKFSTDEKNSLYSFLKGQKIKLTLGDLVYMKMQLDSNAKVTLLDTTLIKNDDWQPRSNSQTAGTNLSLPIFSKSGNIVFIVKNHHGKRGGTEGGVEVFRKVKSKWVRLEIPFWYWMS